MNTNTGQELLDQLRSSWLFPLERVDQWPEARDDEHRDALLQRLVRDGWLTDFQRERIAADRLQELLIGNYRLIQKLEPADHVFLAEHRLLGHKHAVRRAGKAPL